MTPPVHAHPSIAPSAGASGIFWAESFVSPAALPPFCSRLCLSNPESFVRLYLCLTALSGRRTIHLHIRTPSSWILSIRRLLSCWLSRAGIKLRLKLPRIRGNDCEIPVSSFASSESSKVACSFVRGLMWQWSCTGTVCTWWPSLLVQTVVRWRCLLPCSQEQIDVQYWKVTGHEGGANRLPSKCGLKELSLINEVPQESGTLCQHS